MLDAYFNNKIKKKKDSVSIDLKSFGRYKDCLNDVYDEKEK